MSDDTPTGMCECGAINVLDLATNICHVCNKVIFDLYEGD